MKTREILTAEESQVSKALRDMKIKTLEGHAQKILQQLGQPDFDAVMLSLIKRIPMLTPSDDRFSVIRDLVHNALPETPRDQTTAALNRDESIQRLSVLLMVLIAKKFNKVHSGA